MKRLRLTRRQGAPWCILVAATSLSAGCAAHPRFEISLVEPTRSRDLSYRDDAIAVQFVVTPDALGFSLKNVTSGTIRIPWDDVALVSVAGEAETVAHKGRIPINSDLPQAPTVIPAGSTARDDIIPWSHIEAGEVQDGGILPVECGPVRCTGCEELRGAIFRLHMPLEIDGSRRPYSFKFRIDSVVSGKVASSRNRASRE